MRAPFLAALCAFAPLLGCGSSEPAAAGDAGPTDAMDAGMPDAQPALVCACEPAETCRACYEKIGECCYEDPTILGQIDLVVDNCERMGACAACCNECAALSCDELVAADLCPAGE